MLPMAIQKRLAKPGLLERELLNYLQKSGARIDNSKTIASVSYYHQLSLDAANNATFFTGNFIAGDTNVVGNFVRPQSEHVLIYAIRFFTGDQTSPVFDSTWVEGNADINSVQNATMTITNNSEVELKNYPMTDFLPDLTTKDQGMVVLDQPILWLGQTELTIRLSTADPSIVFGADISGRFELIGIGLI